MPPPPLGEKRKPCRTILLPGPGLCIHGDILPYTPRVEKGGRGLRELRRRKSDREIGEIFNRERVRIKRREKGGVV